MAILMVSCFDNPTNSAVISCPSRTWELFRSQGMLWRASLPQMHQANYCTSNIAQGNVFSKHCTRRAFAAGQKGSYRPLESWSLASTRMQLVSPPSATLGACPGITSPLGQAPHCQGPCHCPAPGHASAPREEELGARSVPLPEPHPQFMLLPVDNDGCDLLVHEDQDGDQESRERAGQVDPPWILAKREHKPPSVKAGGLKRQPVPGLEQASRLDYFSIRNKNSVVSGYACVASQRDTPQGPWGKSQTMLYNHGFPHKFLPSCSMSALPGSEHPRACTHP